MKYLKPNTLRRNLFDSIDQILLNKASYVKNPTDHSRTRKLSFKTIINSILQMSGSSINNELLSFFNCSDTTPTAAAFVQQRSKILPTAFEDIFKSFTNSSNPNATYKSYRVLAIDGSDLHVPTNPKDKDSYFPRINDQRPYNLLHLNALYDVCGKIYVDTIIQKSRNANENQALIDMVDRNASTMDTLIIADRGYESYNALAHIQEKGWKFLFRVKDATSSGGIANGLDLPQDNEYDIFINLHLSAGRTKDHWELYKNKNTYKRISHPENFDFFINSAGERDVLMFYHLPFRILKIKLGEDTYETLLTNLPAETFSLSEIKKLYSMRWGIETSFRDLKYPLGLLNFHARKTDLIYQEIYAHLLLYNFVSLIMSSHKLECLTRKHDYKSSFSIAIHASRLFIKGKISCKTIKNILSKYLTPIRPNRKAIRRKKKDRSVMSFNYRLS
ncbi:Transposase DDE domain-containing protein [Pseudobutyrivibrio sp. OR37]|uniref:IS4 family transposase n=1 Tax=Pseudobutyrivibrio sp. OR37 TaxID=1798186 RepID=UPI0008F0C0E1|nr:IS4 family transposase [Pseudobutyrivibrio sp. OR37]SFI18272.1 Transposase DDE domain-containing protein [Pseudobutyrivibrio sp. OR37]